MAYNKSKYIDAAQKYLQQGKLPQAITEYQQILKNEPKDQVTLMTLGDLFVRQGETFQALEYFERLAKIFLADGFTTKAIAIYKKVAKLAPEEGRPLERLAELYVQQGVLSEARPLYLQLAEVHLKAGRQPQAAALFRKLLEAEPDNLRVHTRLAELHLAMGNEKDALAALYVAMQRVFDHRDHLEAIRLADRILKIDSKHLPTLLLKVRALTGANKTAEATALLESLPEQDSSSEITTLLLEHYLQHSQLEKAASLAEKVYAREPKNYPVPHQVALALLEAGNLDRARSLLVLIRNTMIDSGDHESLAQTFSKLAERRPDEIEPLEWLVDLYGRASDSFRLPDALAQLAQAHEKAGNDEKALAAYEQLLDRSPEDETTRRMYIRLRARMGLEAASGEITPAVKLATPAAEAKSAAPQSDEPKLEEETARYVTQILTDVDLFSSYGLTQKAVELLEAALDHAPLHAPILERLLDLSLATGNDRRTAELAKILEQLAIERKDRAKADHYAEFGRRFQRAATNSAAMPAPTSPSSAAPPEFAVPIIEAELDEPISETPAAPSPADQVGAPAATGSVVHEVDLSDEWEALSKQLEDAMKLTASAASDTSASTSSLDEAVALLSEAAAFSAEEALAPQIAAEPAALDFELQPEASGDNLKGENLSADALLAELAIDFESVSESLGMRSEGSQAKAVENAETSEISNLSAAKSAPVNGQTVMPVMPPVDPSTSPGPLSDLFEEFRSAMGESSGQEDEDIETHYNLGIAYREMGLLEESISEFQKVAKASDKGQAFRYAMQCCTLLGLAFMEKGQPAIAVIWYQRALLTPGLDQESILALRYDLGMAQELAGDTAAAFNTFSQVYAMSIDYRDVSERIATIEKAR